MAERECYHCKQFVEECEAHDCWTTTEAALAKDLSEDLRKAWVEPRVFLPRPIKAPQVRKSEATSKTEFGNQIQIRHRNEVEAPITDWLPKAYDFAGAPNAARVAT